MKRFSSLFILTAVIFLLTSTFAFSGGKPKRELYQLTVYQYTTAAQETILNNYCKNALHCKLNNTIRQKSENYETRYRRNKKD